MNGCMASALVTASASPATAKSPACPSKQSSTARLRSRTVSCRATGGGGRAVDDLLWLPRREILTGLGGVAASLVGYQSFVSSVANAEEVIIKEPCAGADPVNEHLIKCMDPTIPCPPKLNVPIVDFTPELTVKRIRRPVHLLDREYQEKYKEAMAKMKALPASNPLSFVRQAAIHEAHCDKRSHYDPDHRKDVVKFNVHSSGLFAPWHHMYIYFYEKALGQLIGDDTFVLPFWNWDAPEGMVVPALFKDSFANSLYVSNRNPDNLENIVDLNYLSNLRNGKYSPVSLNGPHGDKAYQDAINNNLCTVYQQQIRIAGCARSFLGEKLCADNISPKGQDSLEAMAHTTMHVWVGRPHTKNCTGGVVNYKGETNCANDMGFLGSAGRDPLFYSHHSNVDRMWHIWTTKLGGEGFKDPEWLNVRFRAMAPNTDPMVAVLAKLEELGRKADETNLRGEETNRRIEEMRTSINLLHEEQNFVKTWKPELENKVTELQSSVFLMQKKLDLFVHDPSKFKCELLVTLNASFVFYDDVDNPHLVRIKFRDVVDTTNLGYTYDAESEKNLPWKDRQLTSLVPHAKGAVRWTSLKMAGVAVFPVTLKMNQVVEVPAVAVPAKKEGQPRVLVIHDIEYDPGVVNKFDVALNVPKGSALEVGPQNCEFAGSFAVMPASSEAGDKVNGGVTFSIEECLKDIKAADDGTVDVIIVPRTEGEIKINSAPAIQS
nr:unnamed protein product [Digitaria exilis]